MHTHTRMIFLAENPTERAGAQIASRCNKSMSISQPRGILSLMSWGRERGRVCKKRADLPSLSENDKWADWLFDHFQCCIAYYLVRGLLRNEIEKESIGDSLDVLVYGGSPNRIYQPGLHGSPASSPMADEHT